MNLNRRRFVGLASSVAATGVLSGCGAGQSRSQRTGLPSNVAVEALDAVAARPILRLSELDSPLVIDSVRLLQKDGEYFLHVRSRDGVEGIAVTNDRASQLYPILKERVIPYFIGKDARELEDHLFGVYRYQSNYKLQSLALWCPVAWVEFAVLDMLGRAADRSIGELFGPIVRRQVPYYVASSRRDSTPQEEVEHLQRLIDETGAKAVKYRVGGRMSRNEDAMRGRTKELIPLSRKVLGDRVDIHADSNSSYDPPQAIEIGRMLEDINAVYFEEPCPFDHLEDTQRVTEALTIPVAGGEQESSERRFRWMIAHRGVDIVQPDLQYYGGLVRSTRVARMAALAGMPTTVHISGGFGFVYMLHFASYVPDVGRYQEYKKGIEKYAGWFDPPLKVADGAMTIPTGPGVGITHIADLLQDAREV